MNTREDKYGDVLGNVWRKLFKLHELFEIVVKVMTQNLHKC